jgi:AcrR family transcriptional regulator
MLDGDEPNPTPNPKTSQQLLDAAERLFYERGVRRSRLMRWSPKPA